VTAYGPAVADDPGRCGELLREAVPEDGAGVTALLRALEARVPARLALLTEPLALAPLTSGLVRRLVEDQGLSEEAARWAVESWAVALGKGDGPAPTRPGQLPGYEHVLSPTRRRWRVVWYLLPLIALLAAFGGWWWLGQRSEVGRISARTDGINCLALSADGRSVLAGCADKSLRLWDVATGNELLRLDGHEEAPRSVALAPDGRLALSCGGLVAQREGKYTPVDCAVRAWDLEADRQREPPLGKYEGPVWSVAFASDGRRALACTGWYEYKDNEYITKDRKSVPKDCFIRVYDVATGQELRKLEGHKELVTCAAFTPDGSRIVSGSRDNTLRLWDVVTGRELRRVELTGKPQVTCLAVSPDGRRLLTGEEPTARLRLWDLEELEELDQKPLAEAARGLAFSPDGSRILVGSDDHIVRLLDAATLAEVRHFPGHAKQVTGVAFLPDGQHALSGSADGTIRVWRLPP
jgi:WD40 repeat protein